MEWITQLYAELKHRRVIRAATIYILTLWPVIQIVDILSPALGIPDLTLRYILLGFAGLFPIVLAIAWFYDLRGFGFVRSENRKTADRSESDAGLAGRGIEFLIIFFLTLAIAVLFYLQYGQLTADSGNTAVPAESSDTVKTLAVLPLVTFSDNSDDRYFADGLTEELLNVLSRLSNLRVAARTSSFAYKDVNKDVRTIGRELGVSYILEGSVTRNDINNSIRVTAQLIEVSSGSHLWSKTFDHQYRDIFQIQDEIAGAVVAELKVTLMRDESDKLRSRQSVNPEALVAYSMGQSEMNKRTRQGLANAVDYFNQAILSDPSHIEAFTGLAEAHALLSRFHEEKEVPHLVMAMSAVDKAMNLDSSLGVAWAVKGLIYSMKGEKKEALDALENALKLSPNNAMAQMWYGQLKENPKDRNKYLTRAFELDPGSPVTGYTLAREYLSSGNEAEALKIFSSIVKADPFYPGAYLLVAEISEYHGRLDEAVKYYRRAYSLESNGDIAVRLASLYVDLRKYDKAEFWLGQAEQSDSVEIGINTQWLRLGIMSVTATREGVIEKLRDLASQETDDFQSLFHAIRAAYHLREYDKVVWLYERVKERHINFSRVQEMDMLLAAGAAYKWMGKLRQADELLMSLESRLQDVFTSQGRADPELWFTRARLEALKGDNRMVLVYLQRAIDEGWRQSWRPEVDPSLESILETDSFRSMMAGLETKLQLMREQIAFDEQFESDWQES